MITKQFVQEWSERYNYRPELEQKIINHFKGSRDYLGSSIFEKIIRWKAPRVITRIEVNEEYLREITKIAFNTINEKLKIEVLTLLGGVSYRVASTILHFRFPDKYPIMDYRAWGTLQEMGELTRGYVIKDDFKHWETYFKKCREIVKREQLSGDGYKTALKILDQALWQYSKENSRK